MFDDIIRSFEEYGQLLKKSATVATVLTTEVVVNFENFFEGVLAVN